MKHKIFSFPFYIFSFPLFNVLYLYSQNVSEVEPSVIVRPMLVLLLITGIIYGMLILSTKKSHLAAFITFLVMFSVLNYGAIYAFLKAHPISGFNFGRHIILAPVWLMVLLLLVILVFLRKIKITKETSRYLNLFGMLVLVIAFGTAVINAVRFENAANQGDTDAPSSEQAQWLANVKQQLRTPEDGVLPDIYYIIPDMFAREDAILTVTGYDNKEFIEELEGLGFYVATCSRSNYASTQLSIASSLNINYLDQIQNGILDRPSLADPTTNSLVRTSLEQLGYQIIVFDNNIGLNEIKNADVTIAVDKKFFLFEPINPFEGLIFNNSIFRILYDTNLGQFSRFYEKLIYPFWQHVNAQKNIFEKLPTIVSINGPKFVFVHIMMPHPPFLIHEDGTVETDSRFYREALNQPVNQELFIQGYLMQLKYVQDQLFSVVTGILANADNAPIIIIQGDHGISGSDRLDILNAYYVPAAVAEQLYQGISPVNSFRIIFNGIFGTRYELLNDVSWYSEYPDWFDMQIDQEHNLTCQPTP